MWKESAVYTKNVANKWSGRMNTTFRVFQLEIKMMFKKRCIHIVCLNDFYIHRWLHWIYWLSITMNDQRIKFSTAMSTILISLTVIRNAFFFQIRRSRSLEWYIAAFRPPITSSIHLIVTRQTPADNFKLLENALELPADDSFYRPSAMLM